MFARQRRVRSLGILLLILGVGHVPLPRAEYHSIGHNDGPNQVCELHRHLLRWHPSAGPDDRIAVLHWHWLVPRAAHDHDRDHGDDQDGQPPLVIQADEALADGVPSPTVEALPRLVEGPTVVAPSLVPMALIESDTSPRLPVGAAVTSGDPPATRTSSRIALLGRRNC